MKEYEIYISKQELSKSIASHNWNSVHHFDFSKFKTPSFSHLDTFEGSSQWLGTLLLILILQFSLAFAEAILAVISFAKEGILFSQNGCRISFPTYYVDFRKFISTKHLAFSYI